VGQQPRALIPGISAAHRFGAELRRWRRARGYSLARLAPLVLSSASTLNHLELATRPADENVVRLCDEVLGAGGELLQLYAQISDQGNQGAESWEQQSLRLSPGLTEAVVLLSEMSSMDSARRCLLKSAPFAALPLVGLQRDWLLALTTSHTGSESGQSSAHRIHATRAMIDALDELDNRFGGGFARSTAVHFLNHEVLPRLHTDVRDAERRELTTLAAKLCAMCGWMCYDQAGFGLAQRYMTQGLRLCLEGGDMVLAGQIFAGMSHLATTLGHADEALNLAHVGLATARKASNPLGMMRIHAMAARALAAMGDSAKSAREVHLAEVALDASRGPETESEWVRWLDAGYLAGETAQCLSIIGDHRTAGIFAGQAVQGSVGKGRRRAINLLVLASSRLNGNKPDLEGALDAGRAAVHQMTGIASQRSARELRRFQHHLKPFDLEDAVMAFNAEADRLLARSGPGFGT